MNNEWIENTGTVPEGVTKDTVIEVFYRYDGEAVWDINSGAHNNDPDLWTLDDDAFDIIRWRFV